METITYTDIYGNKIIEQQALELNEYTVYHWEDGEQRRWETFSDNSYFKEKGFYLKPEENIEEYISEYVTDSDGWGFYYNKTTNHFGHTFWDFILYRNNKVVTRAKYCYDNQNNLLARINCDIITNEPQSGVKYYYNNNFELPELEFALIKFSYNPQDDYQPINIRINTWELGADPDEVYNSEDYKNIPEVMAVLPWDENPYYHNLLPVLPEDPVV